MRCRLQTQSGARRGFTGSFKKLGITVSESTVAKYVRRHPRAPSQTWRTFLTNHVSQIMAADLVVDGQLVSEREDFQVQRQPRPDDKPKRVEQREDEGRHESRLSENVRNLNRRNAYGVFGRHRSGRSGTLGKRSS